MYLEGSSGLSFSLDGRCGLEFSLENSKFSLENLKELSFSSFLEKSLLYHSLETWRISLDV